MVQVYCNSKKHDGGYDWNYTGDKNPGEYVTCPKCHYKVRIPDDE